MQHTYKVLLLSVPRIVVLLYGKEVTGMYTQRSGLVVECLLCVQEEMALYAYNASLLSNQCLLATQCSHIYAWIAFWIMANAMEVGPTLCIIDTGRNFNILMLTANFDSFQVALKGASIVPVNSWVIASM